MAQNLDSFKRFQPNPNPDLSKYCGTEEERLRETIQKQSDTINSMSLEWFRVRDQGERAIDRLQKRCAQLCGTIGQLQLELSRERLQAMQNQKLLAKCKISLYAENKAYGRFFKKEGFLPKEKFSDQARNGGLFSKPHTDLSRISTESVVPVDSRHYFSR